MWLLHAEMAMLQDIRIKVLIIFRESISLGSDSA